MARAREPIWRRIGNIIDDCQGVGPNFSACMGLGRVGQARRGYQLQMELTVIRGQIEKQKEKLRAEQ